MFVLLFRKINFHYLILNGRLLTSPRILSVACTERLSLGKESIDRQVDLTTGLKNSSVQEGDNVKTPKNPLLALHLPERTRNVD